MPLKKLAILLLCLSGTTFASSVNIQSLNLIRGMDGSTVRCETKSDFYGRAKHGAYTLTNAKLKVIEGFKASLNIEIQTLRCVNKAEGIYRFELIRPDEEIVYSVVTGSGESVEIRTCTNEGSILVINNDYLAVSEAKIDETSRGRFGTKHEIDFGMALSKAEMQELQNNKKVNLRLGLMRRGLVTTTASNGYTDGPLLTAGGIFYLWVELSLNEENQMNAKIIN